MLALCSLAGGSSRSDGGSAHLLAFGRVPNGAGAESETGRVRRPLLADWLKGHHAYGRLRPHARLLASARRMLGALWCQDGSEDGVVIVVRSVKTLTNKINYSA